jgi:hypothetical protein
MNLQQIEPSELPASNLNTDITSSGNKGTQSSTNLLEGNEMPDDLENIHQKVFDSRKVSTDSGKTRMAYTIFASMLVCGTLYLNITSFFPIFA